MTKISTLSRRQKISRTTQAQIRRSMDLAMLEPRMLFCALHDGGLDDLPTNLGTFPAIHAEVDTDYAGVAAGTTGTTATVSGATVPVSDSAVPVLHSNSSATAKLYLDF